MGCLLTAEVSAQVFAARKLSCQEEGVGLGTSSQGMYIPDHKLHTS